MKKYLLIVLFLLINIFWVAQNNRLPFIGDDARWLQETNNLAVVLKQGDFGGFAQRWQDMFITNTNSYPRTPLFTLLSVPTMMVFGPNEKAALVTNLVVFAVASWLVYLVTVELFKQNKQREWIALLAVALFNLAPGYYGMARLCMSEVLQTLFVLLLTLLTLKWGDSKELKVYPVLGLVAALGMLLRFILPVYLVIPGVVFIYRQWKLKSKPAAYLGKILLLLLVFVPVAATWYSKNLITYWEFTRFTSTGTLAEISSLGPVWSPVTWLRYWKVIALWHFGWPLIAGFIVFVIVPVVKQIKKWRTLLKDPAILFLVLSPLPALIATTLSLGKTARYFLPAEVFWIILIAWAVVGAFNYQGELLNKRLKVVYYIGVSVLGLLVVYPFVQSALTLLPHLPATGYLSSSGAYLKKDTSVAAYNYILEWYRKNKGGGVLSKIYLVPEQVRLNDAELIWFFTQNGEKVNTIGEFSPQISLEQGQDKVAQADILILEKNPDIAKTYMPKYTTLANQIRNSTSFKEVGAQDFANGSKLLILKRIK